MTEVKQSRAQLLFHPIHSFSTLMLEYLGLQVTKKKFYSTSVTMKIEFSPNTRSHQRSVFSIDWLNGSRYPQGLRFPCLRKVGFLFKLAIRACSSSKYHLQARQYPETESRIVSFDFSCSRSGVLFLTSHCLWNGPQLCNNVGDAWHVMVTQVHPLTGMES